MGLQVAFCIAPSTSLWSISHCLLCLTMLQEAQACSPYTAFSLALGEMPGILVHLITLGQLNLDIFFLKYSQVQAKLLLCSIFALWPRLRPTTSRMLKKKIASWPRNTAWWPPWARTEHFLLPVSILPLAGMMPCLWQITFHVLWQFPRAESQIQLQISPSEDQCHRETHRGGKCDILFLRWGMGVR